MPKTKDKPHLMAKIYTALNKEEVNFNLIICNFNYIIFEKMSKLNFHPYMKIQWKKWIKSESSLKITVSSKKVYTFIYEISYEVKCYDS